ncbi:MAG TPA: hypothetical protein VID77_01395 [Stellaceae bacterium]|jgi:hypothetical protein|nr:hypothetical protein [Casimicrobiaceae bacterium]
MSDFRTRRQLLLGSVAWIGGLAAVAASLPAGAAMQQVKVPPTSDLGIAIANRCKVSSADHDAIKAQLAARLAANPMLGSLSEKCPLCGCPIVVSR